MTLVLLDPLPVNQWSPVWIFEEEFSGKIPGAARDSVGGMFSSESAPSHTSRKFGGRAESPVFRCWPNAWPSLTMGTRTRVPASAGGCPSLCLSPRCQRGGEALARWRIKALSCVNSDGDAGTLAKALIHPLWFCLWKVLDQAVHYSSVITVLVGRAFNCPFKRVRPCLLHMPHIIIIIMRCWTGF